MMRNTLSNRPRFGPDRRRWQPIALGCAVALLLLGVSPQADDREAPFRKIQFINPDAPYYEVPAVEGKRYKAKVPATLDLAEMARISVEGVLTQQVDREYAYETYQQANFPAPPAPAIMYHSFHDFNGCQPKYLESLGLLRYVCGSEVNLDVDEGLLNGILRMIGPEDGLTYVPVKGRPWALFDDWHSVLRDPNYPPDDIEHIYNLWPNGRTLLALTTFYMRDPDNAQLRETVERMVNGVPRISVEHEDLIWFPFQLIYRMPDRVLGAVGAYGGMAAAPRPLDEGLEAARNQDVPEDPGSFTDAGTMLGGLTRYYRLTKDPLAGELAGKLANYVARAFREDGSFKWGHTHANCNALIYLADYGDAVGAERFKELARKGYAFARVNGESTVGYFPEGVNMSMVGFKPTGELPEGFERHKQGTSESCATAHVLLLAIKLTEYGIEDRWEDIDRYVRNHFVESQLRRVDWIDRVQMPEKQKTMEIVGVRKPEEYEHLLQYPTFLVDENVPERIRGAFSTTCSINDWNPPQVRPGGMGVSSCCTANATRAIFFAWRAILDKQDDNVRINLLLNRADSALDIDSYLPYTGQVDFLIKRDLALDVRIPEYVAEDTVKLTVNGEEREFTWDGRYIAAGRVAAGDTVTLTYPLEERTLTVDIPFGEIEQATLVMKGNTVVEIQPLGLNYPFYMREHYRQGTTLWKETERFESARDFSKI